MPESKATESAPATSERMVIETQDEIGHGYCQPRDFSDAEIAELRRLASVAWFRMESRDLERMIAEFNRRNSAPTPNTETYVKLHRWCLQQTSRYPVWFGQPVPAIGVFWAYGKAALTTTDFENSPGRIRLELKKYISGSDDFANCIYDDVQPYSEREPWRG